MKKIINYFFELGMLKKYHHNGTMTAGVKIPDTVAEHSYRAAVIAYVLGKLEKVDAEKAACMLLFHDAPEARIGDHNKIAQRYIDREKVEKEVLKEQVEGLPSAMAKDIEEMWIDKHKGSSKLAQVAHDADLLETAIQGKEYLDIGHPTQGWIDNVKKHLKTQSAKKLVKELEQTHFTDWWKNLKKI
ncbi:HD family hydrolase [Patescibacteria group bacterium]